MKQKMIAMLLGVSVAAWLPSHAWAAGEPTASAVGEIIQDTVTVQSVDVPNRMVTVQGANGVTHTLHVPPEVQNLPQLKAGDRIRARYSVALAAEILKPGEVSKIRETTESATTAPPGAKPGGMAQRTVKSVITVKAVDPAKHTLTFEGPQAGTRTVTVKDPAMQDKLKQLKPGDNVEVVYREALAIDVQPVKQ
ncbi:hypothetical protein D3870_06655 [Noviherbaspirillum cavernae]|uniref:Copper-binding protein n=1 Tax=Noviherbaspirillum cavernae TaxID=2320862 RepID=A0A418WZY0_9BURK|nr:hypothetical protein [Noviherbaspirillum cavernae]RJG05741.1 hypothetical protein D3870_06655 [Noviherbaspirillum cavernae]